jgi:hypothetical protein
MTVSAVLDAAGRRRSPATMPGYHAGRPPRNKGRVYPADPPTVEEIAVTGLQGHLIVSGGPPQAADVGRLVLFVSGPEDEESDLLFQAGKFNFGPFPQICDVLADA